MAQTLTHDQVYDQLKDGDIMFVADFDHVLPRLIQFFTRSHYSHCAILFWVQIPGRTKRLMVVEAQGGTTRRIQDFDYYCKRKLHIVAAPKDFSSYQDVALARIGQVKYGYIKALYVGLRDFFWDYLKIKLPLSDVQANHEICSEFVGRCLGLNAQDMSPQDLFEAINKPVEFIVVK